MIKNSKNNRLRNIQRILEETNYLKRESVKLTFILALLFFASYIVKLNLAIPAFLFSLIIFLKTFIPRQSRHSYNLIDLAFLFVLIFGAGYFVLGANISKYWIPFLLLPMLSAMLLGQPIAALLITMPSAFTMAALAGNDFQYGILLLVGGVFSIITLKNARKRIDIVRAGLISGLAQSATLFLINDFKVHNLGDYAAILTSAVLSSIIVVGALPIFEFLFRTVTNISLLELADFNHPLLQRMIMEAPGTYHHSLVVGNLSDAASNAVGANALLARVGAYYHDVGKLHKPDYFSENQNLSSSKHDILSPTMSKIVIMNHIKEGAELAKQHRFNSRLIDFILQHHGTSLVYYFYRRALETSDDTEEVKEEGFRYPGPKPDTKESAIVLLADSVEAATRTLKEPNPTNINDVVHKIINNKFIDGQLDQCDLTLKDLERISAVFSRILCAIYHSRISYPQDEQKKQA